MTDPGTRANVHKYMLALPKLVMGIIIFSAWFAVGSQHTHGGIFRERNLVLERSLFGRIHYLHSFQRATGTIYMICLFPKHDLRELLALFALSPNTTCSIYTKIINNWYMCSDIRCIQIVMPP